MPFSPLRFYVNTLIFSAGFEGSNVGVENPARGDLKSFYNQDLLGNLDLMVTTFSTRFAVASITPASRKLGQLFHADGLRQCFGSIGPTVVGLLQWLGPGFAGFY